MSRIVVTGAAGFIGRSVVTRLVRAGHAVAAESVDALARRAEPADVVVHLAWTPRHTRADHMVESNVSATEAVLEFCRRCGARCVFASTAGVYRDGDRRPQDEEAPKAPRNAYAAGKLVAEERCRDAASRFNVPCTILRLFNVYGPGQQLPFLVPYVVQAVAASEVVELRLPEAVRDFVFVDDVARAFSSAVDRRADDVRVFNIGSGVGTRIADLVALAGQVLGKPAIWRRACDGEPEVSWSVADIGRARSGLGWQPLVPLDAGLAATCEQSSEIPALGQ